jgi:hypothetical protein
MQTPEMNTNQSPTEQETEITLPEKLIIPDYIVTQELSGELVILNLENEGYYHLNKVASHFWELLEELETVEAVVIKMLELYDVDEKTLLKDLKDIIDELVSEKIVFTSVGLLFLNSIKSKVSKLLKNDDTDHLRYT